MKSRVFGDTAGRCAGSNLDPALDRIATGRGGRFGSYHRRRNVNDVLARLRLVRAEGVGPVTYRRLLARFSSAAEALHALPELARRGGRASAPRVPAVADTQKEIDRVHALGARLVFLGHAAYPAALAELEDAPPCIAVAGDATVLTMPCVGMVGSRNASANGRRIAETIAEDLARAGIAVVSGLARGIDTAAHLGALRGGKTIACIAGGLDIFYPPENEALQRRIAEHGAVIAEMPPGTSPQARHFPRRNRIIAGLSQGVVVVEAAHRSGSLITARQALDAGREVFAVPGSPLDPRCRGSNGLLRDGAHLTETAEDVLLPLQRSITRSTLPLHFAETLPPAALDESEAQRLRGQLIDLLGPSPTVVDDLIRRCQLPAAAVMSVLLELELAGRVETLPGNRVALIGDAGR
jgi:DNA processing protein